MSRIAAWWQGLFNTNDGVSAGIFVGQGDSALPIMYFQPTEDEMTTLNPYDINMYLDYGPIEIFNDDRTIREDERETFNGWYFTPKIDGATISLFENEIVVMYVQIENPYEPNEYESWSCASPFQAKNTLYVGEIYNYLYGTTLLSNDAVSRDSATVADQTYDHPEYVRNGPWMAANNLSWYSQEYSVEKNYASMTCTAVRQWGEGQKGFFDLPTGDRITLNMGYRVYEDASLTRARIHRDYANIQFDLLENSNGASQLLAFTT